MRAIFLFFFVILFCGGCVNQGDFGAKFCAVYRNYDSAANHLRKYIGKQQYVPHYYWMFLGVAEMYRGNISEMHAAFENAEQSKEIFPELFLAYCNWYIEGGNIEKARFYYHKLKTVLEKNDYSGISFLAYRVCLISEVLHTDTGTAAFSEKYNGNYEALLSDAVSHLKKKLILLEKSSSKNLFALHQFTEPVFAQITFGMTIDELYKLLGKPYKEIFIGGMQKRRIMVYHRKNFLIGFFFTQKSDRLGEVMTAQYCNIHGLDKMRLLKQKASIAHYDDVFFFTNNYHKADDFCWICLGCKK